MSAGRVFYATLNMGLGHATRSLPLMREFRDQGWEVLLGSSGRSLAFLRRELPECPYVQTPDYAIEYSRGEGLLLKLALQAPRLARMIRAENRCCRRVVAEFKPDLIVSDHCYGMYHPQVPSYFISHQIYFALPPALERLEGLPAQLNFHYHRQYRRVIIPDLPGPRGGLLSGKLSRLPHDRNRYVYGGLLSSVCKYSGDESLDLLVTISGPEPQRTLLEEKILAGIDRVPGRKVVVLGKSESADLLLDRPDLKIYAHLPRETMSRLFNQARMVVSRPGYSTLMELAELGKPALLIPTPGQTEQTYLAEYMLENRWFYSVSQAQLELPRDLETARQYPGLFYPEITRHSVRTIFENVLNIT